VAENGSARIEQKEQLLFDFTSAFKATTKAGRSMRKPKKVVKPVLSSQAKNDSEVGDDN